MSTGEFLSFLINIAVGVYLAWFYPRHVRERLGNGRLPPAFGLLSKVLQPLGVLLIVGSLFYLALRLGGTLDA